MLINNEQIIENKGINDRQFNAIAQSLKYNLRQTSHLKTLIAPLKRFGITDFCYMKFKNNTRMVHLSSVAPYVETYLDKIAIYSRLEFFENLLPIIVNKKSWHLYPNDYCVANNNIFLLEQAHGIAYGLIYSFWDEEQNQLERFEFYLDINQPNCLSTCIGHLEQLELFCYSFKENAMTLIQVGTKGNALYLQPHVTSFNFRNQNTQPALKKYFLNGLLDNMYLTVSEFSCLCFYIRGLSIKNIAIRLKKSPSTISKQLENIKNKSYYKNLHMIYRLNSPSIFY